jgi:hypothetical protein
MATYRLSWRVATVSAVVAASMVMIAPIALAGGKKRVANNDRDVYGGAFSDPVESVQLGSQGASGEGSTAALDALTQQSSFPLRLSVGEYVDKGWSEDATVNLTPTPVSRHYKIGSCEFVLRTGEFGVRQYRPAGGKAKGEFVVTADALQRNSTIPVGSKETIYLSTTTELVATADAPARDACEKAFSDRRVSLGRASLGRSAMDAVAVDQSRLSGEAITAAGSVQIFLTWDEMRGELSVEEASGLPPSLESGIFAVKGVTGDYYVALAPAMDLGKK